MASSIDPGHSHSDLQPALGQNESWTRPSGPSHPQEYLVEHPGPSRPQEYLVEHVMVLCHRKDEVNVVLRQLLPKQGKRWIVLRPRQKSQDHNSSNRL